MTEWCGHIVVHTEKLEKHCAELKRDVRRIQRASNDKKRCTARLIERWKEEVKACRH